MNLIGVKSFNQSNILKQKKKYVTKTMAKITIQMTLQAEAEAESRINFKISDPESLIQGDVTFFNHTS